MFTEPPACLIITATRPAFRVERPSRLRLPAVALLYSLSAGHSPSATIMHLKYFGLVGPPFAAEPDTDIFFQEAERTTLLRRIYASLQSGGPVIRLTGAEGTGKTLLCLLLARLLPAEYQVVCLSNPAGSFDELLRAACVQLGQPPEADMPAWLHRQLDQCRTQGKRFLLIVDQAETMFPAALERLLRTVFAAAEQQTLLVLLAGRPTLNERVNQLRAYCPDMELPPSYLLEPLTEAELAAYLSFRLKAAGLPEEDSRRAFSAEAVRCLVDQAKGNLHTAHRLADQALHRVCAADRYFPVLAVDVPPPEDGLPDKDRKPAAQVSTSLKLLAGLLLLFCAGLFLFRYSDALRRSGSDAAKHLVTPVPVKPAALLPDKITLDSEPKLPPEPEKEEAIPVAAEETASPTPTGTGTAPQATETVTPTEIPHTPSAEEESLDTPPSPEPPKEIVSESPAAQAEPVVIPAPQKKIVELLPGMRKTKPAPKEMPTPQQTAPPRQEQSSAEQRAAVPAADQLYQEMLAAGSLLQRNRNSGKYTIQLMSLPAADGGTKLKSLIVREEYLELRSQLKLLRSPKELVVFHGSYGSIEEANAALDNMPLFLRKQYHPTKDSIVPVADALSRTGN
jgi:type II secretory pathway predicted ATPase ExeA/septal ring-binding cell division protein DamX